LTIFDAILAETPAPDGTQTPAASPGSNWPFLVLLVGMIALMFFMSRRGKKQQAQQGDFRRSLDVGQRVMTVGGMIGVISRADGDVLTIMSPSGDESLYIRRAIKSEVPDDEWEALTQPYPPDEDLIEGSEANLEIEAAEQAEDEAAEQAEDEAIDAELEEESDSSDSGSSQPKDKED
jgi:preprotein translocase subunit YajC